jgi:hypothetical protein
MFRVDMSFTSILSGDTDKKHSPSHCFTVVHLSRPHIILISTSPNLYYMKEKTKIMVMKEKRQYTTHRSRMSCSVRGKLVMTDFH